MAAFVARGDIIEIRLSEDDRSLLGQIPGLLGVVGAEPDDPAYDVLHRSAYPDDAEAAAAFDGLVAGERAAARRLDRSVVSAVADGQESLTRLEALSLLRSMNEARLVLAARRGAFEEGGRWELRARTDPGLAAVMWMAQLQSQLIRAVGRLSG